MANVLAVQEWAPQDDPDKKRWYVKLEGQEHDVPCYNGAAANLEVGKPLPEGWEIATGKTGKPYLKVPGSKSGGFGGGRPVRFADTAEGFYASDERIDRRRAAELSIKDGVFNWSAAEEIYLFLRTTSPARPATGSQETAGVSSEGAPATSSPRPQQVQRTPSTAPGGSTSGGGAGQAPAPAVHGEGSAAPRPGNKWKDDAWAGMPGFEEGS